MKEYRPEIDGLRALAVVPVVFFHAGLPGFEGGYIGVDIFFVISGFLITSIVVDQINTGKFSFLSFYERRARRILPAIFLVMMVSLLIGWFVMLPDPYENLAQSVVATVFFANNLLLWQTSGYWSLASEFKPLVHTWSLGVEEQYYFIWPLMLVFVGSRARQYLMHTTCVLLILSFTLSVISVSSSPDANFYLLPFRAWELLAGCTCAFLVSMKSDSAIVKQGKLVSSVSNAVVSAGPRAREVFSMLGVISILISIGSFNEETPFPSQYALLPVIGSCLIVLFCSRATLVGKCLSSRPFVYIGLVSYSFYLWHQPLFAFLRVWSYEKPSTTQFMAAAIVSFLLAALSYKFVEKPFRRKSSIPTKSFLGFGVAAYLLLVGMAVAVYMNVGYGARVSPNDDTARNMHIEYNSRIHKYKTDRFQGASSAKVLIVGDSFARDFANVMLEMTGGNVELVYRESRLDSCAAGGASFGAQYDKPLWEQADTVLLVSSQYNEKCWNSDYKQLQASGVERSFVVGTKNFGYNLNAFMRVPVAERPHAQVNIDLEVVETNRRWKATVPQANYIDAIWLLGRSEDTSPVFTGAGEFISQDRRHLTEAGAIFLAERLSDAGVASKLGFDPSQIITTTP